VLFFLLVLCDPMPYFQSKAKLWNKQSELTNELVKIFHIFYPMATIKQEYEAIILVNFEDSLPVECFKIVSGI